MTNYRYLLRHKYLNTKYLVIANYEKYYLPVITGGDLVTTSITISSFGGMR